MGTRPDDGSNEEAGLSGIDQRHKRMFWVDIFPACYDVVTQKEIPICSKRESGGLSI